MVSTLDGTTFCVQTFGCQMNKHDSERITGMLESLGSLCVGSIEAADIVVFMTCCVREAADIRLYGQVASLKNIPLREGSPLAKRIVAVGGCIGQRDGEKLTQELKHLDVVFGTHNIGSLPSLLFAAIEKGGPMCRFSNQPKAFQPIFPARASILGRLGFPSPSAATIFAPTASCPMFAVVKNRVLLKMSSAKLKTTSMRASRKSPCSGKMSTPTGAIFMELPALRKFSTRSMRRA